MIALTRLPSGRRASTSGELSSIRRPITDTMRSTMRRTCLSSRKDDGRPLDLAVALDVDVGGAVDHHLGHGVVAEERLEWPIAEDVVRDLAGDLLALLAAQRRPVERELGRDGLLHALGEVLVPVGDEQLRAELRDAGAVDLRLQIGVRVLRRRRRRRGGHRRRRLRRRCGGRVDDQGLGPRQVAVRPAGARLVEAILEAHRYAFLSAQRRFAVPLPFCGSAVTDQPRFPLRGTSSPAIFETARANPPLRERTIGLPSPTDPGTPSS